MFRSFLTLVPFRLHLLSQNENPFVCPDKGVKREMDYYLFFLSIFIKSVGKVVP